MSYFPDCRAEGAYNEKNLKGWREKAIKGFDMAMEDVDCLFDNLNVYPEVAEILDPDTAVVNKDKAQILREAVSDWLERKRNELITAFIDGQAAEGERDGK